MNITLITIEEVEKMIQPLQKRISDLEAALCERPKSRCRMRKAQEILYNISAGQVMRLIYSGVIKNAERVGRPWIFDVEELKHLAANPQLMDLSNLDNYCPQKSPAFSGARL